MKRVQAGYRQLDEQLLKVLLPKMGASVSPCLQVPVSWHPPAQPFAWAPESLQFLIALVPAACQGVGWGCSLPFDPCKGREPA